MLCNQCASAYEQQDEISDRALTIGAWVIVLLIIVLPVTIALVNYYHASPGVPPPPVGRKGPDR